MVYKSVSTLPCSAPKNSKNGLQKCFNLTLLRPKTGRQLPLQTSAQARRLARLPGGRRPHGPDGVVLPDPRGALEGAVVRGLAAAVQPVAAQTTVEGVRATVACVQLRVSAVIGGC